MPARSLLRRGIATGNAMSRSRSLATVLLCVLLLLPTRVPGGTPADGLAGYAWVTEEYFPYNYTENGEFKGVSVDLLRLVWAELGLPPQPVVFMPWARVYEHMRHEPATVLFCVARTPEREHAFRWAGPIAPVRFALIARKDRHIRVDTPDDLRGLSVGTLREDVTEALLADYRDGPRIQPVARMDLNIGKLMTDRLDLVAYEESAWRKIADRHGLDPERFETVFVLGETQAYYAFPPDTPAGLVADFQNALDRIKAGPAYQRLLDAYLR